MKQFHKWWLCVFVIFGMASGVTSAQEEWMPDPNLQQVVRESLGLSEGKSFKPEHLLQLTRLDGTDRRIVDVTGLEHATNLTWLALGGNEISDLRSLTELIHLETLYLWVNPISDISPLANFNTIKSS